MKNEIKTETARANESKPLKRVVGHVNDRGEILCEDCYDRDPSPGFEAVRLGEDLSGNWCFDCDNRLS